MRFDIQVLRGLAVSLVVAYHVGLDEHTGFLGVDIFFVVSGYLITRMVSRGLEAGSFRFRDFYTRRAKRLLPAAYVTLALTALAAMWLLPSREFVDFTKTHRGAVTFTGNLALLGQSGYFDGAPEGKPLLHIWSLAIEEQFYLGLPLLLWLLGSRSKRIVAVAVVVLASLSACLLVRNSMPSDAFYRVEFRAWELGIGALASYLPHRARVARWLYWPAWVVLLALPWLPLLRPHPGEHALMVDLATAVVLVGEHPSLTRPSSQAWLRPLARVGDVSYSWYLLHWPAIVLLNATYLGSPPTWLVPLCAVVTLLAAIAMYRFVEQPVRRHPFEFTPARLALLLGVSGLLLAAPDAWRVSARLDERALVRADNLGFAERCDFDSHPYASTPICEDAEEPTVLVWGDSMAGHLVRALAHVSPYGIRQATKTSCGPLLGHAPVNGQRLTQEWAADCHRFNEAVLEQLARSPSIQTVVLASSFERFVNPKLGEVSVVTDEGEVTVPASVETGREGLRRTVDAITAMGKRVVVVAPPAAANFDVGTCLERRTHGMPTLGPHASCQILDEDRRERQRAVLALMAEVGRWPEVRVADVATPLCSAGVCRTEQAGVPLYVDHMHLTVEGSILVATDQGWAGWGL